MPARPDSPTPFTVLVIPDFPVWAARALDPRLRNREVAVVAAGRLVAGSEGLADRGLVPGQAVERVRLLAPEAVIRPLAGAEQRLAWEEALATLNLRTPWIEPLRPGRACLRLATEAEAAEVARELRARVGLAADRSTALLAALASPEGSLVRVPPGSEEAFRSSLPLEVLGEAGVGPATLERLAWLGFSQVGSLARLTRSQLGAQFEEGALLDVLVRTEDRRPVPLYTPPPVVAADHAFEVPAREPGDWEPVLRHLVDEAAAGLGERRATLVTVRMEGPGQKRSARRMLQSAAAEAARLWTPARLALQGAWPGPGFELEHLELVLGGLVAPRRTQGHLWAVRPGPEAALKALEARFPGRLLRITRLDPWSLLPEEAATLEPLGEPPPEGRRDRRSS